MKDQVYERKMINFNDDCVENLNRYIIDNIIEAFLRGWEWGGLNRHSSLLLCICHTAAITLERGAILYYKLRWLMFLEM